MPYPRRTTASDALLDELHEMLTKAKVSNKGSNKCMISVVTVDEFEGQPRAAFYATSGFRNAGTVRSQINNLIGHGSYYGVFCEFSYSTQPFSLSQTMMAPHGMYKDGPAVPGAKKQLRIAANDIVLDGPRHCAEPKAIQAAADSHIGSKISGMSTMWWGDTVNEFYDPQKNPNKYFALPCKICQANADRTMIWAEHRRLKARTERTYLIDTNSLSIP